MPGLSPLPAPGAAAGSLSGPEKAAIVVRLLLAEGAALPLSALPEAVQADLTEQIARMRMVDRETLLAVAGEFAARLEAAGLSFPAGLDGALDLLGGRLSAGAAGRLRRLARAGADPWERIAALDAARLLPLVEEEAPEVGAVILSKLAVPRAAELLGLLPGPKARRIAWAMSQTGAVAPATVARIGLSLAAALDAQPACAFDSGPVERVGAILNHSAAATREAVLQGLEEEDAAFATRVRRAIFTFADIPARLDPRDVPKLARAADQARLVAALAGATGPEAAAAEFLLAGLSQRLAASLREEMETLGKVREKDAEEAMAAVVATIRELEAAGELALRAEGEE